MAMSSESGVAMMTGLGPVGAAPAASFSGRSREDQELAAEAAPTGVCGDQAVAARRCVASTNSRHLAIAAPEAIASRARTMPSAIESATPEDGRASCRESVCQYV